MTPCPRAGAQAIPKEEPIYAIVRAGGRQYRVEPDQQLSVDRIQAEPGSTVELDVLMLGGDGGVRVGAPTCPICVAVPPGSLMQPADL